MLGVNTASVRTVLMVSDVALQDLGAKVPLEVEQTEAVEGGSPWTKEVPDWLISYVACTPSCTPCGATSAAVCLRAVASHYTRHWPTPPLLQQPVRWLNNETRSEQKHIQRVQSVL